MGLQRVILQLKRIYKVARDETILSAENSGLCVGEDCGDLDATRALDIEEVTVR